MNIRCLSSLLIFICFVLCQPSFAQSNMDLEIQSILNQNPSLLETYDEEKNNVKIKEDYVSENQEVVNTNNALVTPTKDEWVQWFGVGDGGDYPSGSCTIIGTIHSIEWLDLEFIIGMRTISGCNRRKGKFNIGG